MKIFPTALLLCSPLLFAAATCVSDVQQNGAAGPWAGEVGNAGDQAVYTVTATARIFDAGGREFFPGGDGAIACPSKLLPGERGAFELFAGAEIQPELQPQGPALPLRAEFDRLAHENVGSGQARGDGLLVTLLERDDAARRVRVDLTNNSAENYAQVTVCGILRTPDGRVAEVARADGPPLPEVLRANESITLDLYFNTLSEGTVRFHALGLHDAPYDECCPLGASTWHSVDAGPFSALLPPGWQYLPQQGVDSLVGSFAGDGAMLVFDYGMYSGLPPAPPGHVEHEETIGGRTARIQTAVGATGRTAVLVHVASSGATFATSLLVEGSDLTPAQQQVALQIFRSLRFEAP